MSEQAFIKDQYADRPVGAPSYCLIQDQWPEDPWPLLRDIQRCPFECLEVTFDGEENEASSVSQMQSEVHLQNLLRRFGWQSQGLKEGRLIALRQKKRPAWWIDRVLLEDSAEVSSLFQRVFHEDLVPSHWAWKYGHDQGYSVIARSSFNQRLLAHYGATLRQLLYFDQKVLGLQICDVMVDPLDRGILGRRGVFFEVAAAFQESFFGFMNPFKVAYGFPNARAMRLASLQGLYTQVDSVLEVRWAQKFSWRSLGVSVLPVPPEALDLSIVEALWEAMRRELKDRILVIRDAAYLRYRYQEHPVFAYQVLLVQQRFSGRPLGLAFIKVEGDHVKLMDIIGKLKDMPAIIHGIRSWLDSGEGLPLTAWVTPRQWLAFEGSGGVASTTDLAIPCHALTPGANAAEMTGRWWISYGDTDFL